VVLMLLGKGTTISEHQAAGPTDPPLITSRFGNGGHSTRLGRRGGLAAEQVVRIAGHSTLLIVA
jgi:hypothetical protein